MAKPKRFNPLLLIVIGALVLTLPLLFVATRTQRRASVKAASACTYQFVSGWGTPGAAAGNVNRPQGIYLKNNVISIAELVDGSMARVSQFTTSGLFQKSYGGTPGIGLNQFYEPVDIIVDSSGSILVPDGYHIGLGKVKKVTTSGTFSIWAPTGSGPGQFSAVGGIAVDSSGNVYVVDNGNHRIQKFNASGQFLLAWGSQGSGSGQFSFPRNVAVLGNSVYVADTNNHRIQKFNFNGTSMDFVSSWGTLGTGPGQFNTPIGVAVGADGSVYVADTNNHRIQKFTSSGVFVTSFGSIGTAQGQLLGPRDVAVDNSSNVYVADTGNNRIQIFSCVYPPPPYTYLLYPIADTYVNQSSPATNYGSSLNLFWDGSPTRISYLKFDLKPLAGKTITSAILRVRVTDATSATRKVYLVSNTSWNEFNLNYNTKLSTGTLVTSFVGATPVGVWVDINVTSAVKSKKGSLMTLGLQAATSFKFGIASRESAAVGDRPQLFIQ